MNPTELGAILRAVRRSREASQREVAETVGVSRSTIGNIENGRGGNIYAIIQYAHWAGYAVIIQPKSNFFTAPRGAKH